MESQIRRADKIGKKGAQSNFVLPPERWEAFCQALDAPPREIPARRRLFTEQSVLDNALVGWNAALENRVTSATP